jgi:hypothetical protein
MTIDQEMPDAFVQFSRWFHQDVFVLYHSLEEAIAEFIAQLDSVSKLALRTYLGNLIASGMSDEELEKLWKDHGAEIGLVEQSSIRRLFLEVQSLLAASIER